jgi:hypothetical protein
MFAPDACLQALSTDVFNEMKTKTRCIEKQTMEFHLISDIFCPPRPIIQPIRSLAIVISRCVCSVVRFAGRPFGMRGAAEKRNNDRTFFSPSLSLDKFIYTLHPHSLSTHYLIIRERIEHHYQEILLFFFSSSFSVECPLAV